jgi:heptosyltransferase-1
VSAQLESVLVVRLSAMGDIIHTMPAVSALRDALPSLKIGWLIEERWTDLLCARSSPRSGPRSPQRPLVDRVHTVDTKRWRKSLFASETRREFFSAIAEVKAARYDAVIDFQGLIRSAIFARLSGAKNRYGFAQPRESPARWFYTSAVAAQGTHVIEQNLSLAQSNVETPLKIQSVQFPHDEEAERKVEAVLAKRGVSKFAMLNPGAGWGAKQWPSDRYGAVAKQLAQAGLRSLINFGPGEETLAQEVANKSGGTAQPISLSLAELIAVTRRASLFIGGDTGPMHLAAALGVPVVAIFGPTNPVRNGPFSPRSIVLRNPASVTDHSRHAVPESGLLQISVEQITAAVHQLLGSPHE